VATAIAKVKEINPRATIRILSLERDLPDNPPLLGGEVGRYQRLLLEGEDELSREGIHFTLLLGDARQRIREVEHFRADAVFHDGFSPYRNPELWSIEFLAHVKRLIAPQGRWVSYTSALCVRAALVRLGFKVGSSKPVGRKRGGTVASLQGRGLHLSGEEAYKLRVSPYATPLVDENLDKEPLQILIDYLLDVILRGREFSLAGEKGL
jgi:chorismate dehydratase